MAKNGADFPYEYEMTLRMRIFGFKKKRIFKSFCVTDATSQAMHKHWFHTVESARRIY